MVIGIVPILSQRKPLMPLLGTRVNNTPQKKSLSIDLASQIVYQSVDDMMNS
jgi:hypothetical protein